MPPGVLPGQWRGGGIICSSGPPEGVALVWLLPHVADTMPCPSPLVQSLAWLNNCNFRVDCSDLVATLRCTRRRVRHPSTPASTPERARGTAPHRPLTMSGERSSDSGRGAKVKSAVRVWITNAREPRRGENCCTPHSAWLATPVSACVITPLPSGNATLGQENRGNDTLHYTSTRGHPAPGTLYAPRGG